jgi:hypothetical protein
LCHSTIVLFFESTHPPIAAKTGGHHPKYGAKHTPAEYSTAITCQRQIWSPQVFRTVIEFLSQKTAIVLQAFPLPLLIKKIGKRKKSLLALIIITSGVMTSVETLKLRPSLLSKAND